MRASRPSNFALRLRIPAWSPNTAIRVNGNPVSPSVSTGFASLFRQWKDGVLIELELSLPMRLEPIDPQHLNTVALMHGPVVLFALAENAPLITRKELLSSVRLTSESGWQANTASGPMKLQPFTAIHDEPYMTYLTDT